MNIVNGKAVVRLSSNDLRLIVLALEDRGDKKSLQYGDDSNEAKEYYDLSNKFREIRHELKNYKPEFRF